MILKMPRINAVTIILLIITLSCWVHSEETAGTRYSIFDLKPDARIQGLGGVSASLEKHLFASIENPAVGATLKGPCVSTSHTNIFLDENVYSAALGNAVHHDRYGIYAAWTQLTMAGIESTAVRLDPNGNTVWDSDLTRFEYDVFGSYSHVSNAFYFGGGTSLVDNLSAGIQLKGLVVSLADSISWGMGLDAGLLMKLKDDRFQFGLSMKDAVPVQIDNAELERMGIFSVGAYLNTRRSLLLSAQIENRLHSVFDREISGGLEWVVFTPLLLRCGINRYSYSFGAGFRIGGVRLNYAVVNHYDFGLENPHRVTIEYYFGRESSI